MGMDPKNVQDLKKIISFCRKNGITRVKMDGFEIELHPTALYPESDYKKKKASEESPQTDALLETEKYSEEDLLFWSSAGIPDGPKEN